MKQGSTGKILILAVCTIGLVYFAFFKKEVGSHPQENELIEGDQAEIDQRSSSLPVLPKSQNTAQIAEDDPQSKRQPTSTPALPQGGVPEKKISARVKGELESYMRNKNLKTLQNSKGKMVSILNHLPVPIHSDTDAKLVAHEIARYVLGEEAELQLNDPRQAKQSSPLQTVFRYRQTLEGYEMIDSFVDVFVANSSSEPYMVNQNLKDVRDFNSKVILNFCQSVDLVKVKGFTVKSCTEKKETPMVFVSEDGSAELAWIVYGVEQDSKSYQSFLFYVSCSTGKILKQVRSSMT